MPDLGTAGIVFVMSIISIAVKIAINSALLFGVLKVFKIKSSYRKALRTAAIAAVVLFFAGQLLIGASTASGKVAVMGAVLFVVIPMLTYGVNTIVFRKQYKEKTKKALLVGLAWSILGWLISGIVVGLILMLMIG